MKVLVAAEGKTLDNRVARKFSHASWYLEVDSETQACTARQDPDHSQKQEILQEAAANGVTAQCASAPTAPRATMARRRCSRAPGS